MGAERAVQPRASRRPRLAARLPAYDRRRRRRPATGARRRRPSPNHAATAESSFLPVRIIMGRVPATPGGCSTWLLAVGAIAAHRGAVVARFGFTAFIWLDSGGFAVRRRPVASIGATRAVHILDPAGWWIPKFV